MAYKALNEFAINVAVYGEPKLIELGNKLRSLGADVDKINKAVTTKKKGGTTTTDASRTEKNNKKVAKSSTTRRKQLTKDQKLERDSMNRTTARLRAQSNRFEGYNRKIQHSARLSKNEITDMFRRVALWSTGIGVLFGTLSKIKFIFGAVKDLEVQMAELKKVMDDDTPFRTAQRALFTTALSMSVAVDQAAEIAKTWAQQGYELNEVATLTTTALLGVNAANLTAGQSVEFLTSAIKSFKVEASETEGVIDSIMAIQADFAITSANLAKGLQVAGAITAQLGGDMNELFGMMTAVGEVTRETGNVIGNSLKTQLARIQQPRTIAYLERLGIATRRITDEGAIKRLSAFDIFKQISEQRKSGKLTQDQVLDISLKIGGIRKFKDALVLIENFDTAVAAMGTGFLAYGDAADASAIIQETLTRKIDKLNTAFVELGATVGELGNLEALKVIVEGMTKLLTGLTSIARGESALGGLGSAAFQAIPIAIIGGFAKFLGKRIFQNIRGTELRSVQEMANLGTGPAARTVAQSRYTFFGKNAVDPKFAKAWGNEIKNISAEAKKAGINFTSAHKQMAFMSAQSKAMGSAVGGLDNSMKGLNRRFFLSMRAFRAGFAPGTIPGGFGRGAQAAGGLATARIMSSLGGLFKGLAVTGGIILAITGIIKLVEYLKDQAPKTIEFDNVIDPTTEASKAFIGLAGTLVSVKEEAQGLNITLEDYVRGLGFAEKQLELQPIAETIGRRLAFSALDGLEKAVPEFEAEAFRAFVKKRGFPEGEIPKGLGLEQFYDNAIESLEKGVIRTKADLKKAFIQEGLDPKEIPTEEATKKIQKFFRDFIKFEVTGDYEKAFKETGSNLSIFMDEFSEALKKNTITIKQIEVPIPGRYVGTGPGGSAQLATRDVEGVIAGGEIGTFFKELAKGLNRDAGDIGRSFKTADKLFDIESMKKTFGLEDQESAAAAFNKVLDTWEKVSEDSGDLIPLSEVLGPYLDRRLATFTRGGLARSGVVADETETQKKLEQHNKAMAGLREIARKRITSYLDALKAQDQGLFRVRRGLETILPNSLNKFSDAALDASFALLKVPDLIFNATSNFVSQMQKIDVKQTLAPILGVGSTATKDVLAAFRQYATSTSQIAASVRHTQRTQANVQERIADVFRTGDTELYKIINDLREGLIEQDEAYIKLEDLGASEKAKKDKTYRKQLTETEKIITDSIKLDQKMLLMQARLTDATQSWGTLVDLVNRTLGVDISGEVEVKKIYEDIAKTGDTKAFEAAFAKLIDRLIGDAARVITKVELDKLSTKFQQQANKLTSSANSFFKTGVDITDAQIKSVIATQQALSSLDIQAAATRRELADPELQKGARETLLSRLELIEAEKKGTTEMNALSLSMNLMAIEADKITNATDSARQAFTQLFADVKQFDPTTNAVSFAFEDAFNQIANTRLEFISERFTNQLLAGFEGLTGSQFGEFLLGEEIKEPMDLNTDALKDLTLTLDEIKMIFVTQFGTPVGGVTGEERFGAFGDIMEGESFAEKAALVEKGLEQVAEIFSEGGEKIEFKIEDILGGAGQILGGIAGGALAGSLGKETNAVNIGTSLGGAAGTEWLTPLLGSFAGPIGSIFGGLVGAIFGRDKEQEIKDSENIKRTADNTAALVAVDSRLINAPASFTLPAGATTGGSVTWTGNIIVNGANPQDVVDAINNQFNGTTNYNTVAGA